MMPDDFRRVRELFEQAVDQPPELRCLRKDSLYIDDNHSLAIFPAIVIVQSLL